MYLDTKYSHSRRYFKIYITFKNWNCSEKLLMYNCSLTMDRDDRNKSCEYISLKIIWLAHPGYWNVSNSDLWLSAEIQGLWVTKVRSEMVLWSRNPCCLHANPENKFTLDQIRYKISKRVSNSLMWSPNLYYILWSE